MDYDFKVNLDCWLVHNENVTRAVIRFRYTYTSTNELSYSLELGSLDFKFMRVIDMFKFAKL